MVDSGNRECEPQATWKKRRRRRKKEDRTRRTACTVSLTRIYSTLDRTKAEVTWSFFWKTEEAEKFLLKKKFSSQRCVELHGPNEGNGRILARAWHLVSAFRYCVEYTRAVAEPRCWTDRCSVGTNPAASTRVDAKTGSQPWCFYSLMISRGRTCVYVLIYPGLSSSSSSSYLSVITCLKSWWTHAFNDEHHIIKISKET